MVRIPPITERDALDAEGRAAFDLIAASRGEVTRPFALLLHSPTLASAVSELGAVVRFGSRLADADRELVTIATGLARGCAFVRSSHLDAARAAGVDAAIVSALERGDRDGLGDRERTLVTFVDELCRDGHVSPATFDSVHALLGTPATVELVVTVGYYTLMSISMGAFEAC
jgi:AhpD family alkylhydroperoxidase